jgi:hypothetical protein
LEFKNEPVMSKPNKIKPETPTARQSVAAVEQRRLANEFLIEPPVPLVKLHALPLSQQHALVRQWLADTARDEAAGTKDVERCWIAWDPTNGPPRAKDALANERDAAMDAARTGAA